MTSGFAKSVGVGRWLMIENIIQMRKRHQIEIDNLHKRCRHRKVSDWQTFYWAPGHLGNYVKLCLQCGEERESKPLDTHEGITTISTQGTTYLWDNILLRVVAPVGK